MERISRWSTEPATIDGKVWKPTIRDSDTALLAAMAPLRRRFLRRRDLAALLDRDASRINDRLTDLKRAPLWYVKVADWQRDNVTTQQTTAIRYELAPAGIKHLAKEGIEVPKRGGTPTNFAHADFWHIAAASLDIARVQNPDLNILWWDDIKASGKLPEKVARDDRIAMTYFQGGKERRIRTDGEPFVVYRRNAKHPYIFVYGIECDMGTERRNKIEEKFEAYIKIIEDEIYHDHFNADTFMVPWITTSEANMQSMMKWLAGLKPSADVRRRMLFKYMPIKSVKLSEAAPSTGYVLTEPWKRVGLSDFNLSTD